MQIKRNTQFLFAAIRPCRWFSLKGLIYPIFQNFLSQIFATTTIQCGVSGISFVLLAALGKIINSSWKLSPDYFDEFGWGGNFEKHFFCLLRPNSVSSNNAFKKKKERKRNIWCLCLSKASNNPTYFFFPWSNRNDPHEMDHGREMEMEEELQPKCSNSE